MTGRRFGNIHAAIFCLRDEHPEMNFVGVVDTDRLAIFEADAAGTPYGSELAWTPLRPEVQEEAL